MKQIKRRIAQGFESSCYKTKEFVAFANSFKRRFTKILSAYGCTNIEYHIGHFEVSFFFTQDNGQVWYGNIGDVRWFNSMYIRRAKDYKDFHGDSNININDLEDFCSIFSRSIKMYENKPLYV